MWSYEVRENGVKGEGGGNEKIGKYVVTLTDRLMD